jgi:malonyl CoA-acyl carrier protein transacylase
MLAYVFPGQGSQRRGMGQGLFDEVREFADNEREIDRWLGYSIRKLCLEDPDNRLRQTRYTQPSVYIVNALHYFKAIAQGERPSVVAGHSLGEYNALLAAGAFDLLTGLRLVQKRGELMSVARNGGMAAIIGLEAPRIRPLLDAHGLSGLDVANYNSPAETVISGPVHEIERAGPIFQNAGAQLYVPLPVSAAFHSRYMCDAGTAFASFLEAFSFGELKIPVISNVAGRPYPLGASTMAIKTLLVRQMTESVLWTQSVRYLIDIGVTTFREIGPGMVLTKLVRQTQLEPAPSANAALAG